MSTAKGHTQLRASGFQVYRYATWSIASSVPLDELPVVDNGVPASADISFAMATDAADEIRAVEWLHHWHDGVGNVAISLGYEAERLLLCFPGLADFWLDLDADRIIGRALLATGVETIRHLLLDQVLPRILAHRGHLVLHASAVQIDERSILLMGDTGSGKSTLAAMLDAGGYPLLSDDGLELTLQHGQATVCPTYPSLRLWPDSIAALYTESPRVVPMAHYSAKQRILVDGRVQAHASTYPVTALFVLAMPADDQQSKISVDRLSPRDACMAIIANTFQLIVTDRQSAVRTLAAAADVAAYLPVYRICYPRSFAWLPAVSAALVRQARQPHANGHTAGYPDVNYE